jgi:hypothetical protein
MKRVTADSPASEALLSIAFTVSDHPSTSATAFNAKNKYPEELAAKRQKLKKPSNSAHPSLTDRGCGGAQPQHERIE